MQRVTDPDGIVRQASQPSMYGNSAEILETCPQKHSRAILRRSSMELGIPIQKRQMHTI
jgi:hypothetical protein